MDNLELFEVTNPDGTAVTYVKIDKGNGEFSSMPKSVYDEQQVEHLTAPDNL